MLDMRLILSALLITGAAADRGICKVRNTNDSGEGSLRNCLENANNSIGGAGSTYTIIFVKSLAGQTITIPNGSADYPEVTVPETLVVRGPKGGVTIDGTQDNILPYIFFTGNGVSLRISSVNVIGGFEAVRMISSVEVDLRLNNCNFRRAVASCVFVSSPIREVALVGSSFAFCGNDGVNVVGGTQTGAYNIAIKRVVASDNSNTGIFFRINSSPAGGTMAVSKLEANNNGNYGMEVFDVGAGRLVVTVLELSTFNNNNEGCEFINADVLLIRLCEFNNNREYGLGLEQSHLTAIRGSTIIENGAYGIDLEALSSIEAIDATKILGNGLGVIKCGPEPVSASRSAAGRAESHEEPERP